MAETSARLNVHPKTFNGQAGAPDVVTVSVAEAAKLCGCSDDTIRRRLNAGLLPGAFQDGRDGNAPWRVPVSDLVQAGMCGPEVLDELDQRLNPNVARLANQVVDLRAELLAERAKSSSLAEQLAQAKSEVVYLRELNTKMLQIATGMSPSQQGAK